MRSRNLVLAAIAALCAIVPGALLAAKHSGPRVLVVEQNVPVRLAAPSTRPGGRRIPPPPGVTSAAATDAAAAATPACRGWAPGPSWTCENGQWTMTSGITTAPAATGGGRIDRANGCLTEQPGPGLMCQGGLWTLASAAAPSPPRTATTGPSTPAASTSASPACAGPKPREAWTCDNGAWVLPVSPAAPVAPPTPAPTSGSPTAPAAQR